MHVRKHDETRESNLDRVKKIVPCPKRAREHSVTSLGGGIVHPRRHPVLASLHRWLGMVARAGPGYDTSLEGAGGDYRWLVTCKNLR
ncbi:hypothetical protein CRG98_024192 [Punica granatum]|uniref:Uncharacterized protein n=1 Tax=Punica granatum TaxID=22663 RepID=A0A2I0JGP6_PUNGR|nr:hypothetical protein CRG98_024192 [Punica granatum]